MALGADVTREVAGGGLALATVGLALGLVAALAFGRSLESLLYGVGSADPATYVATSLLLVGVAAVACLLPARRAARLNPVDAIRGD